MQARMGKRRANVCVQVTTSTLIAGSTGDAEAGELGDQNRLEGVLENGERRKPSAKGSREERGARSDDE